MGIYAHLNNVQSIKKIINAKILNGQIIIYTIEGELDLPMLPNIATQANISPKINIH